MSAERCKALRDGDHWNFIANKEPLCPHCGSEVCVMDHDQHHLYEEGDHEVHCPYCRQDFKVYTRISFSFDTDEQEDE